MTGATSRALIPPVIPGRAERREPGIHNRRPWLWIPGSLAALGPRNDREDARPTQNISALLKDLPLPRRHTPCCEAAVARRLAPRWPRRPMAPAQIKRRVFILALGGASLALPGLGRAQERARRIAALMQYSEDNAEVQRW